MRPAARAAALLTFAMIFAGWLSQPAPGPAGPGGATPPGALAPGENVKVTVRNGPAS
ncbi:MAG TPA: hypothetical protein VGR28_13530 [Candidatus Thermoplasmatota archaeon]|jgi:hypothetical protein|nr:hypothetical protein [Candidatus Thermoplasmatota archaeon]